MNACVICDTEAVVGIGTSWFCGDHDPRVELKMRRTVIDGDMAPMSGIAASIIDWTEFWTVDRDTTDWLLEPVIAAKRAHALYAGAKTGKSYLMLEMAAALAAGRPFLAHPGGDTVTVVYVDFEMTEADLFDRLEEFGYGPDIDLRCLHYALLPAMPALNTPEGAKELVDYCKAVQASLVVIDTFARAVEGEENDASTVNDFYRWTGLSLKAEGIAVVRLDHSGKDPTKGQRGSSAKDGDVDIVWRLTKRDNNALLLEATHRRMSWVPERVELNHSEIAGVVEHRLTGEATATWPEGTKGCAMELDKLSVDISATLNAAQKALRDAGRGQRRKVVAAAQKYRRMELDRTDLVTGTAREPHKTATFREPLGNQPKSAGGTVREPPEPLPVVDMGTAACDVVTRSSQDQPGTEIEDPNDTF